jgi:hypothetical protein
VKTLSSANVTAGLVEFCDASAKYCSDIHILGTGQLTSAGTTTVKLLLGVGTHNIKAVFVGTSANARSTSAVQSLSVDGTGIYASSTTLSLTGIAGNYTVSGSVASFGNATLSGEEVPFLDTSNSNAQIGYGTLGTPSFETLAQTTYLTGNQFTSVAVGDFNGDGIPDMAIANWGSNTVSILLGNGTGTFTQATDSPIAVDSILGTNPDFVAVGDFNGDGILDFAVATFGGDEFMYIFLGNGTGTFRLAGSIFPAGSGPVSVAVADFNGDGIPDLAVANEVQNTVSILLGNGDGTFALKSSPSTGNNPYSVATADFNGDGIPDLAVANYEGGTVSILLGAELATYGATEFSVPATFGIHNILASYPGDISRAASQSGTVTLTILATPSVNLTPSTASITTTQSLSVMISVSGGNGNPKPTGSVLLTSGAYTSGEVAIVPGPNLSSTSITIPAGSLATGTDTLTVTYAPDSSSSLIYNSAAGTPTQVSVTKATPSVVVTPSSLNITTAQALSVTVAVSGTPTPTGSVTLSSGAYTSTAATLNSGSATINVPAGSLV